MIKRFPFQIILALSVFKGFSQGTDKPVIPPSPQTAEYIKYINYNVTMYNGVPEIAIPLYTIHMKGLDVPISLSYHASGIKYHQTNGDVGVGWTLNPGYRISRTIYGQPDDKYDMPDNLLETLNAIPPGYDQDTFLTKLLDPRLGPEFPHPADYQEKLDGEYDLFNYMLPTENGSFMITNRTTKAIQTMDESDVKINYNKGNSAYTYNVEGFLNFDVTDNRGNNYLFGERTAADVNIFESVPDNSFLNSAWALTDIVTALGDQLKFKYTSFFTGGWHTEYRSETLNDMTSCSIHPWADVPTYTGSEPSFDAGYQTFLVNEISNDREKISFERNPNGSVANIKVYNSDNIPIRSVSFYYSLNALGTHRMLDSIQIKDRNASAVETYKFGYENKDYSYTIGSDQWGYYNSGLLPTQLHNEFQNYALMNQGGGTVHAGDFIGGFNNRKRTNDDSAPVYFTLNTITYPTGGKTMYEYESNRYQDWNGTYIYAGGLRIKSITSNDLVGNTLTRSYTYGDDGCGIPKVRLDESYFVDETIRIAPYSGLFGPVGGFYNLKKVNFSTAMKGDVGATGATSSLVNYPKVTETYTNGFVANGKIVYNYKIGTEYEVGYLTGNNNTSTFCTANFYYQGPPVIQGYRYWDKPLPNEIDYYTAGNELVKKETFSYTTNISYLTGLKAGLFATAESYNDVLIFDYYNLLNAFIRYLPYTITYGKNILTNKKYIYYQNGQPIVQNTDYQYNNKNMLSQSTTYRSDGNKHHTFYNYATDYAPGSGFVDAMVNSNIIATPIEKVEAEEDNTGHFTILSGVISKFRSINPVLAESVLGMENALPVPQGTFKFSNRAQGILPSTGSAAVFAPDNTYKSMMTFDQYDFANNLIQKTKTNDIPQSYLWDYKGMYPVAEVKNAAAADIAYTSFETEDTGGWTVNPGSTYGYNTAGVTGRNTFSGALLRTLPNPGNYILTVWSNPYGFVTVNGAAGTLINANGPNGWKLYQWNLNNVSSITINSANMDEVRLYPQGAQMTTYTYDPLIGMTSQCDANNKITYYEYDAAGRLVLVRDQDKNIIKKICYNYSGQPESCLLP